MADLEDMSLGMLIDILIVRRKERETPQKRYATEADIEAF